MINICHINITSIQKHKNELLSRFSQFDVISINESNLPKDCPFILPGFTIFRNDRTEKSGGGVLIAVNSNLNC
jgi:hypothetical protein